MEKNKKVSFRVRNYKLKEETSLKNFQNKIQQELAQEKLIKL